MWWIFSEPPVGDAPAARASARFASDPVERSSIDVDVVPLGEEAIDEVRPDEPRSADHRDSHGCRLGAPRVDGHPVDGTVSNATWSPAATTPSRSDDRLDHRGVGLDRPITNDDSTWRSSTDERSRQHDGVDDRACPPRSPRPTRRSCSSPSHRDRRSRPARRHRTSRGVDCRRAGRGSPPGTGREPRRRSSSRRSRARASPGGDEPRERVALDRHPYVGRDQVEHARLEHVGAGVDQVARFGAGCRLLDELDDAARTVRVVGELDDTERRRVVDADQVNGRIGARRLGARRRARRRRGRSSRRRSRRRTSSRSRQRRPRSGSPRRCRAARVRRRR